MNRRPYESYEALQPIKSEFGFCVQYKRLNSFISQALNVWCKKSPFIGLAACAGALAAHDMSNSTKNVNIYIYIHFHIYIIYIYNLYLYIYNLYLYIYIPEALFSY